MPDSTFEEARRCPKCEQPGAVVAEKVGPHGSKIHTIMCMNSRCTWNNTTYIVQVNPDGTVPPPSTDRFRNFPKIPDRTDEVNANLMRLYEQSLTGGETR